MLPSFTRSIALLGLTLTLCGCGSTWWNPPFSGGYNPNRPVVDSENMRRVMGQDAPSTQLQTEPGDIWPGPLPPSPTLQDLEAQGDTGSAQPLPNTTPPGAAGSPASSLPGPNPARGSSTPPPPARQAPVAAARPSAPTSLAPPPAAREPSGQVYQTTRGPVITNGGTPGYQTTTTPGGGSAIVVPNGNGTSTVIYSDGRVETVPTPK